MKRYKKYIFIILSVLLAGGCVQEDINEALRREAELNVRMGKLREWISDTNNEVRLLATIVNTIPTHDYIESVTELPDGSGTLIDRSSSSEQHQVSIHRGTVHAAIDSPAVP